MIPTAKVLEILQGCKDLGVKAIQFTGGGEPTVHPDHKAIFETALKMGFEISLVTNGMRWVDGMDVVMAKASWVRFSLDAGTSETYSYIRKIAPANFEMCLKHVNKLAVTKRILQSDVTIGVGFVVTADNWGEVILAAAHAKAAGADNFRISAVFQPEGEGYFNDFFQNAAKLCRDAESLSTPTFTVTNMFGERVDDLHTAHPDYTFCGIQHFTAYIGGDLNVYRCCNLAYNPRGLVGSIKDKRLVDLWQSSDKAKNFNSFDAHGCPRCQFNNKNRAINDALVTSPSLSEVVPQHINFV
jgi:MoaA/NifB/PqqE/SkfB family radical SAM enzyme